MENSEDFDDRSLWVQPLSVRECDLVDQVNPIRRLDFSQSQSDRLCFDEAIAQRQLQAA
jgi:hypothetical protein